MSSCTHTDKPLTMIKPKGRPASQCAHCRENRKVKNTHSSCVCGKKGMPPGSHLASCLCHKSSQCTCPSKEKKVFNKTSRKLPESHNGTDKEVTGDEGHYSSNFGTATTILSDDLNFDSDQGLLDYFTNTCLYSTEDVPAYHQKGLEDLFGSFVGAGTLDGESRAETSHLKGLNFPNPPSDADLDLMENMFPLFPLVGNCSFDDNKSIPLSPIPTQVSSSQVRSNGTNGTRSRGTSIDKWSASELANSQSQGSGGKLDFAPVNNQMFTPLGLSSPHVPQSSTSTFGTSQAITQHPRPLRASNSFSCGYPHAISKPRRPESVLSAASTSSNASKQHELGNGPMYNLPKLGSSGAFPPFQLSQNNSTDDFGQTFESSVVFHDNQSLSILSDYEDHGRIGPEHTTPQSSLPSRQPLQTRRKSSLSRSSHSHIHHGGVQAMNKEHPLVPLKSASSSESLIHAASPFVDSGVHSRTLAGDGSLKQVAEEGSWNSPLDTTLVGLPLSIGHGIPQVAPEKPLMSLNEVHEIASEFQNFLE